VNLRGVTITRPVPFDVVIVADNSDSLSWSRDSLSAGLKNLLSRVHGHEARFFVLTTTQYGASSQAAGRKRAPANAYLPPSVKCIPESRNNLTCRYALTWRKLT